MTEALEGDCASRSESEPKVASLRKVRVASLSEMVKPAFAVKKRSRATAEHSGVAKDSTHRKNGQELGRPFSA